MGEDKDININLENLKEFKENLDNTISKKRVTLTQAEYDLLSDEEKHSDVVYFISDGIADISQADKDYIDSQDQTTLNAAKKYTDDILYDNYQKFPEEGSGLLLNSLTDVQGEYNNDYIQIYLDLQGTNENGELVELTDSNGFDLVGATSEHAGLLTATDKVKLDGIETGANAYSLPEASSYTLGGVKTGDNITNTSGTISLTKNNVTTALGFTPPTNGFKKYSTTFTYTERESAAPIGSCTIPYSTSDGFLIITSQYEQYLYLITCRSDITISAIKASSTTPTATRNGSNNTITISNIPYAGGMTGTLTVYSFS